LKQSAGNSKGRIVIKVGSSLFCSLKGGMDWRIFGGIVDQVSLLLQEGSEIVLVSSGAIALGMDILKLKTRPKELPYLQASAAVGQNALMDNYSRAFGEHKINCGQVLLTWDDFNDRGRYLNAKNTLLTLIKLKAVPIINENDTVSTDEIKFGDNDQLSARVASLVSADLLIILSDVSGLLDRESRVIRKISTITSQVKALACPTDKKTCVGGMVTKLEAAKISMDSGIPCVIANGKEEGVIARIAHDPEGGGEWSLFLPNNKCLADRKRWIAFGTKPKGKIVVDEGARKALENKKSLLSVGVIAVEGNFAGGDTASVVTAQNQKIAIGKVGVSSKVLRDIKGKRSDKEVIHRDDMVMLT